MSLPPPGPLTTTRDRLAQGLHDLACLRSGCTLESCGTMMASDVQVSVLLASGAVEEEWGA